MNLRFVDCQRQPLKRYDLLIFNIPLKCTYKLIIIDVYIINRNKTNKLTIFSDVVYIILQEVPIFVVPKTLFMSEMFMSNVALSGL